MRIKALLYEFPFYQKQPIVQLFLKKKILKYEKFLQLDFNNTKSEISNIRKGIFNINCNFDDNFNEEFNSLSKEIIDLEYNLLKCRLKYHYANRMIENIFMKMCSLLDQCMNKLLKKVGYTGLDSYFPNETSKESLEKRIYKKGITLLDPRCKQELENLQIITKESNEINEELLNSSDDMQLNS